MVPSRARGWTREGARRLAVVATVAAAIAAPLLLAVVLGSTAAGVASADHAPAETNFTLELMEPEDHHPGAENVRSGTIGQAGEGVDTDLETLLRLRAVYSEGNWQDCGPGTSEVFGIDRGSDNERYEVDESLEDKIKRFSAGEDEFVTEFNDEDDIGASTHLNSEDRILSLIECIDNPEEPGWYQIDVAAVTGRTADGEEVTFEDPSHYFWICECQDEAEAREELGPPPSEPEATSTPAETDGTADRDPGTETRSSTSGEADDRDGGDGTSGAAGTATAATEGSATPVEDATPTPGAASTPEPEPADWNDVKVVTPARADGPGFGPAAAIAAVLATALLVRRHDR